MAVSSIPYTYDDYMGEISEFSLPIRAYLKTYRWRTNDPVPFSPLKKKLARCRLAIVSTAGLALSDQPPFDDTLKGGDWTYRVIPQSSDTRSLVDSHRSESFDHSGLHEDPNLAFPLDRARELVGNTIGSLTENHLSFMGSITATKRLTRDSAPDAARRLIQEGADVALLIPV